MTRELTHLFRFFVHSNHAFFCDTKQAGHQFILSRHLFLKKIIIIIRKTQLLFHEYKSESKSTTFLSVFVLNWCKYCRIINIHV